MRPIWNEEDAKRKQEETSKLKKLFAQDKKAFVTVLRNLHYDCNEKIYALDALEACLLEM